MHKEGVCDRALGIYDYPIMHTRMPLVQQNIISIIICMTGGGPMTAERVLYWAGPSVIGPVWLLGVPVSTSGESRSRVGSVHRPALGAAHSR